MGDGPPSSSRPSSRLGRALSFGRSKKKIAAETGLPAAEASQRDAPPPESNAPPDSLSARKRFSFGGKSKGSVAPAAPPPAASAAAPSPPAAPASREGDLVGEEVVVKGGHFAAGYHGEALLYDFSEQTYAVRLNSGQRVYTTADELRRAVRVPSTYSY